MQVPPGTQSTGVATLCLAHNCNESTTLSISSKCLPVVAGYKNESFNFLSGPIIKHFFYNEYVNNFV